MEMVTFAHHRDATLAMAEWTNVVWQTQGGKNRLRDCSIWRVPDSNTATQGLIELQSWI